MAATSAFQNLANKIIVNGKLVSSKTTERFTVTNPATLTELGKLPLCGQADIDQAVAAAKAAQLAWAQVAPSERGKMLRACLPAISENKNELASIMATETGKAIRTECRVEIDVFNDSLLFFAGL